MKMMKTGMMLAAAVGALAGAVPASADGGKGMTWRAYDITQSTNQAQKDAWEDMRTAHPNFTVVGCVGQCDAYKGDTPGTHSKRILCFVPGNIPEPAEYAPIFSWLPLTNAASKNWRFYWGWSGGQVALTDLVLGSTITSRADGDQKCKDFFADQKDQTTQAPLYPNEATTARMAEHHDNGVGGWSMGAMIHPGSKAKSWLKHGIWNNTNAWVAINNQTANPWNP